MFANDVDQSDRYQQLLRYLEAGWQIDPPVFVRPTWYTRAEQAETYHFVLKADDKCMLLSVPQSSAVERFVRDQRLRVNRL